MSPACHVPPVVVYNAIGKQADSQIIFSEQADIPVCATED